MWIVEFASFVKDLRLSGGLALLILLEITQGWEKASRDHICLDLFTLAELGTVMFSKLTIATIWFNPFNVEMPEKHIMMLHACSCAEYNGIFQKLCMNWIKNSANYLDVFLSIRRFMVSSDPRLFHRLTGFEIISSVWSSLSLLIPPYFKGICEQGSLAGLEGLLRGCQPNGFWHAAPQVELG